MFHKYPANFLLEEKIFSIFWCGRTVHLRPLDALEQVQKMVSLPPNQSGHAESDFLNSQGLEMFG
ncbi:hypothetical protein pah_c022o216 [Parachlamydia acanthamoebae str. Hall's coccus]|nr:hypothetical protein pah_c022o216 [Parachlamydia acanthamoebae str. Hall's coccus]